MVNLLPVVGSAISSVFKIIDKAVPDKELQAKLKHEIQLVLLDLQKQVLQAQANIIIAEARGEGWLQRNWRPMVMILFASMIAWNGMIAPILTGFGLHIPPLNLSGVPDRLWNLLTVGLGGYIGLRSAEKITHTVVVGRHIANAVKKVTESNPVERENEEESGL